MVIIICKQHEELSERKGIFFFYFFSAHDMNLRCSHCLLLLEKDLTKNQKIRPDMPKNTLRH